MVEDKFPLVEFAHKNSYQASIRMAPYEMWFRDEGTWFSRLRFK